MQRINSAGFRREGEFPVGIDCRGLDLSNLALSGGYYWKTTLTDCNFDSAYLERADFTGAILNRIFARSAFMVRADFQGAALQRADLAFASLWLASCRDCDARGARFTEAALDDSDWTGANIDGVISDVPLPTRD